jgi:hypothetical protein
MKSGSRVADVLVYSLSLWLTANASVQGQERPTGYMNRLVPIANPRPLLADYPDFIEPVSETNRYEAATLVNDDGADLNVRAWRYSYNARGIIEVPNCLRADATAIIVVHPWGIDDGQGWKTPEPAGVAFGCTPQKNRVCLRHMSVVVDPFLKTLRSKAALVAYSLPGREDSIRKKLYRSIRGRPTASNREEGKRELAIKLRAFTYTGQRLPEQLKISNKEVPEYFRQFSGLDAGQRFNHAGFWDLPIPVAAPLAVAPDDVVIYDADGYESLKQFLIRLGIRHVLLAGYHADMCVCRTTAGYQNLSKDFNVFLVGDAMLATFPANNTPRFATNATVSFAALDQFITQVSWVRYAGKSQAKKARES